MGYFRKMHAGTVRTAGGANIEADAWLTFDHIVEGCGAFSMYREVSGDYVQPRPLTELKRARIDRILVPRQKLLAAGWDGGAIGVEGKRSGNKIGPLITQAIDYSRCAFELKTPTGDLISLVMLKWIFIYPVILSDMSDTQAELGSLMAQHRIGYANVTEYGKLTFSCGGQWGILIEDDGTVRAKSFPMGNKRGSR